MIEPVYHGETAVIIGTGPSLTGRQVDISAKFIRFGCNRAFEFNLDVLAATNKEFWDYYWPDIKDLPCDKWVPYRPTADKYGINYIREIDAPGLSTDPTYIHHHHGSGPILINLAYHYGIKRMLLIGWDMRHKGQRHYWAGGEYPKEMIHYTKNLGPNGELIGLIKEMETIKPEDYGIEIINCTPGSSMTCFPFGNIEDYVV